MITTSVLGVRGGIRRTRYSKTSVRLLSVWTMSCNVTMLACFRSFSSDTKKTQAPLGHDSDTWEQKRVHCRGLMKQYKLRDLPSLMAVHGAPSSCSSRISFSATRLSVSLLRPLNTVAYVPWKQHIMSILYENQELSLENVSKMCISFSPLPVCQA